MVECGGWEEVLRSLINLEFNKNRNIVPQSNADDSEICENTNT